jgi:hypothetical protein
MQNKKGSAFYRCPKKHETKRDPEGEVVANQPLNDMVDRRRQRFARDPYGGELPYAKDSSTSRIAAQQEAGKAPSLRQRVYEALKDEPTCDEVLGQRLGVKHHSACARRCENVKLGLVRDSGRTMRSPTSGKLVTIWEVVT